MFTVETNMGSKTYREIYSTENADHAIYFFNATVDKMRPTESARLMRGTETMARKTPKASFIAKEWK